AGHAAAFIGGGAERDVGGPAAHQVVDFGAIAAGEHTADVGLHAVVRAYGAAPADLNSRVACDLDIRLEPGGDHDHVAVQAFDGFHGNLGPQFDMVRGELAGDGQSQRLVVARERVGGALHNGDGESVAAQ